MGAAIRRHGYLQVSPFDSFFASRKLTFLESARSGTGVVLETYVNKYPGYALLAPVMTAITGSAGSIFVSRISTALHSGRREHYFITAASLWSMTCPVVMAFLAFTILTGQLDVDASYILAFFIAVSIQVCFPVAGDSFCRSADRTSRTKTAFGLLLAQYGSLLLWKLDYDPDGASAALLTPVSRR